MEQANMRTRHPRLGLLLLAVGLSLGGFGLVGPPVMAEESNDGAPVIGADPDADTGTDTADPDGADDAAAAENDGASDELAATGSWDRILTPAGLLLIVVGSVLTMVGQPAVPRGQHSRPSSKLRSSFFGLAVASISESVASARRPLR